MTAKIRYALYSVLTVVTVGMQAFPERSEPCEARSLEGCVVATNNWFVPFMASLGIVPEANWNLLDESARSSQLWYCITPQNALVVTWRNALLDRDTDKPLSFQVEFKPDGQFIYRYDLSRLNAETVTNILSGASFAGNVWTTNSIPTNVTSMAFCPLLPGDAYDEDSDGDGIATIDELFVHYTDPRNADSDYDGLSDYEELFVCGTDPLDPIYFRGDELLEVSLNSADFAFGVLPTYNTFGHINFPNTVATTPCIHDFNAPTDGRHSLHILIDGCIPT